MNERLRKLKEEILDAQGKWGLERADIYTKSYKANAADTFEVKRAKALADYLDKKTIYIRDGELVVGNYGSGRGIYELYPEYSFQDNVIRYIHFDFEQEVGEGHFETEAEKKRFREIYGFWKGNNMRERVDSAFPPHVVKLRDLDICCNPYGRDEGQGHVAVEYDKVITEGLRAYIVKAKKRMEEVYVYDLKAYDFLKAAIISLEGVIRFANRYADEADRLAVLEKDPKRKNELTVIAENCRRVPEYPAENFWQACQSMWFIHLIMHFEQNGFSNSIGRFDQYTYPSYMKDIQEGRLTKEEAFEILESVWIKFSEITIGGIKISLTQTCTICGKGRNNEDMTNELSHLCLDASRDLQVLNPQILIRWHKNLDRAIAENVLMAVYKGETHAAFMNDEFVIPGLIHWGVREEDAYEYAQCGCNETEIPGKMIGGGLPRPIFLVRVLELALNGGKWRYTDEQIGPITKKLGEFENFEDLLESFRQQYAYLLKQTSMAANYMDYLHSLYVPLPFASALMTGCIERGRDMMEETEYFYYALGCNDFTAAINSLSAIRKTLFDDKSIKQEELRKAIQQNFEGLASLRRKLLDSPKFGNDDDYADSLIPVLENLILDEVKDYRSFRNNAPWFLECIPRISHVYEGLATKATPDGRLDGDTLPPGISAQLGTDINGPTALLNSIMKINKTLFAGGVISNIRFHPDVLKSEEGFNKALDMISAYLKKGGMHLQVNCVNKETLLDARKNPQNYRDLMVRVSGYIDYFTNMDEASQNDIIKRTEHSFM